MSSAIRPIVRPASRPLAILAGAVQPVHAVLGGAVLAAVVAAVVVPSAPGAGLVIVALVMAVAVAMLVVLKRYAGQAVMAPRFAYGGTPIQGDALTMVKTIGRRFREAEETVKTIPAGFDWSQFAPSTEVLLWEAAGHAARYTELDNQRGELHGATAGTPEAALLDRVMHERADHLAALQLIQQRADELVQLASNAAVAARVTLDAASGASRDAGLPSTAALAADATLDDATQQLTALAKAWTSLDSSTALSAEQLRADEPPPSNST